MNEKVTLREQAVPLLVIMLGCGFGRGSSVYTGAVKEISAVCLKLKLHAIHPFDRSVLLKFQS